MKFHLVNYFTCHFLYHYIKQFSRIFIKPGNSSDGGYEIVSDYHRQKARELAGYTNMPCIVRNPTDDEIITQMVEDNLNQWEEIFSRMALPCHKKCTGQTGIQSGRISPLDETGWI